MLATPITYALRALSTFYPLQKPMVFSGSDSMIKLSDLLLATGQRKTLLVTDSFLIENNKLDGLIEHLNDHDCNVTIFDGSIPNPTYKEVETGLELSIKNKCDSVLAIGGGSVIDVAKVIAAASTNNVTLNKLAGILKVKMAPLPFYVVPTTSGTGSEVTNAAVISDNKTHKKEFFVDPKYVPIAAALDPELLKSLPANMTAAVGMDALTHAIEAYTSRNNFTDTDRDAAMAIKLLFDYLPTAFAQGENLKAREMVAQASFLAGYAFSKSSLGYVHAISHQVSAHYNTPHGLTNAVILPRVLRFNKSSCAKRFAKLEIMMGGDSSLDSNTLAKQFITRVDLLAEEIGIPTSLAELKEEDFSIIAKDALSEAWRSYAVPKVMRFKDVKKILRSVSLGDRNISFA
jgi:alcohol dehydrogenase